VERDADTCSEFRSSAGEGNTCERKTRLLDQERRARNVWSIGELIDAALDGELPSGSGPEFPKNLDPKDTIQSHSPPRPIQGRFTVIKGGREP